MSPRNLLERRRTLDGKADNLRRQLADTRSADKRDRLRRGLDKVDAERTEAHQAFMDSLHSVDRPTVQRQQAIAGELERLAAKDQLPEHDETYWDQLVGEFERSEEQLIELAERAASDDARRTALEAKASNPRARIAGSQPDAEPDDDPPAHRHTIGEIMSTTTHRAGPVADAHEALTRNSAIEERAAELVARLIERDESGAAASWAAAAADDDYRTAFAKLARDPQNGNREFTTAELAAYQRAQIAARSLNLTSGGALVPTHLDPTIGIRTDGSVDPMRQLATTVTVATDTWNGVTGDHVVAEWLDEEAEAADATPDLAPVPIPVHKASAFVPVSFEAFGDMTDGGAQIGRLLADGHDQHEAPAFVTGSGNGQPTGVITGLAAGQTVNTATAGTFASDDIYALIEALPPRFRARARWLASLPIINAADQFETSNGAKQFPRVGDADPVLLRKPLHEHSELDSAVTAGNHILAVGAFDRYVIVDRIGATVELVPHLFGENRRPTGQRGWFLWWRVGGAPAIPNAFRRLEVAA